MLVADTATRALSIASTTISAIIAIWALTDACNRDGAAFIRAGYHRMAWICLLTAGCTVALLTSTYGLLFAAAIGTGYLVRVRARVRAKGSPLHEAADGDPPDTYP